MKMVALDPHHTEILDALSALHFHLRRTKWVHILIEAALPALVDEIASLHQSEGKDVQIAFGAIRAALHNPPFALNRDVGTEIARIIDDSHVPMPLLPPKVIDFKTRRNQILLKRQQDKEAVDGQAQ